MATDFRDGHTFPRRGREKLGEFLWLARVFDKARAKANRTHDGYIYPCPMDLAVMGYWGIKPSEFTAAIAENATDDRILAWLSDRVSLDKVHAANAWVIRQKSALDRHDFEEGVPGAVRQPTQWYGMAVGVVAGTAIVVVTWLMRYGLHH